MTEYSHHFLAFAVLAPADAVVHIAGPEAQLFAERKRFVQRTGRLTAERRMLFRTPSMLGMRTSAARLSNSSSACARI